MKNSDRLIDMTGLKFGHLTATAYAGPSNEGSMWQCKCICGRVITRPRYRLLAAGPNSSCGCITCNSPLWVYKLPPQDFTGKQLGWFTVTGYVPKSDGKEWICKCRCGNIVYKKTNLIKRGNIHPEFNCGCYRHGRYPGGFDVVAKRILVSRFISQARQRGLEVTIGTDAIMGLMNSPCHYCGVEKYNKLLIKKEPWVGQVYKYNGIDRLDSSKGYIDGNVVACCPMCNEGKMDRLPEEYIEHCRLVSEKAKCLK